MTERVIERPAPGAPDFRIEEYEIVASTNALAFERARSGSRGGLWIRADEQSGGRGRRGRDWSSPKGNLYASLLLIDPQPRNRIGELPLVAAVALADALDRATGSFRLAALKWPNDLLVGGAKLSGILLEAETLPDGRLAVVLGFGVNCVAHPELTQYSATNLLALGYRVTGEGLLDALVAAMSEHLHRWTLADGFDAVRAAWLDRAAHLGKRITVRTGSEELTGTFEDLDAKGHLVLKMSDGTRRTIYAGDVFEAAALRQRGPDGAG